MNGGNGFAVSEGICFYLPRETTDNHLWFVISDTQAFPEDFVVCVNVTSYDPEKRPRIYNDPSCVIESGEHAQIVHRSCVCYEGFPMGPCSLSHLEARFRSNSYRPAGENASPSLLAKMRRGSAATEFLPFECREIMSEQGLI